jgi:predicted RNA-binding Zn-ribbon protein involved in translation (DUF1610 family)
MKQGGAPSRGFSDQNPADRAKEADTFCADRRWILGARRLPLRLEKVSKFDRRSEELNLFSQSGLYSIHVFGSSHVIFTFRSPSTPANNILQETDVASSIRAISTAPCAEGYFFLLGDPKCFFVNNYGELTDIPPGHFSGSGFHWYLEADKYLYFLICSTFGHIHQYSIQSGRHSAISSREIFRDKSKPFFFSLTSVLHNGVRFVVVGSNELLVFEQSASDGSLKKPTSAPSIVGSNHWFPSYVVASGTHVAWLNMAELRIFRVAQLFEQNMFGMSIPAAKLQGLGDKLQDMLPREQCPLILSKHYVIVATPNSILGFYVEDSSGTPSFRFPFAGERLTMPLTFSDSANAVFIGNSQNLYRIDMNYETAPIDSPAFQQVKARALVTLESSPDLKRVELLSSLLENDKLDLAIQVLQSHLARPERDPSQSPQEKARRILEQFFIFELQILDACVTDRQFDPSMAVATDDIDFNIFEVLGRLLQRHPFSGISEAPITAAAVAADSPYAVRSLISNRQFVEAIGRFSTRRIKLGESSKALILWFHQDELEEVYQKVNDPKIAEYVMHVLPFVAKRVPPETAKFLFNAMIEAKNYQFLDQLICSICLSESRHEGNIEQEIFQLLDKSPDQPFQNPFSTFQCCYEAGLYRIAAWIAHRIGLHRQAVVTAHRVDHHLTQKYIRTAPRSMQAELCREVDIELSREEGEAAVRLSTPASVADELRTIVSELEQLARKGKESAGFLKDLEEWGTTESPEQKICGTCRKKLSRTVGKKFPCGHCFHDYCLTEAAKEFLLHEQREELGAILVMPKPTQLELQRKDELTASDCPLCGELAVGRIRRLPIFTTPQWGLLLADLDQFRGGAQGQKRPVGRPKM